MKILVIDDSATMRRILRTEPLEQARFGVHALDCLLGALQKAGYKLTAS